MKRTGKVKIVFKQMMGFIIGYTRSNIRIQLMIIFIVCLSLGGLATIISLTSLEKKYEEADIDYRLGMEKISLDAMFLADKAAEEDSYEVFKERILEENQLIQQGKKALAIFITDTNGKILFKTKQVNETQVNLHTLFSKVMAFKINNPSYFNPLGDVENNNSRFITFYPITVNGQGIYLFVSGIPEGDILYIRDDGPLPFLIGVLVFIVSFFFMTKQKMKQLEEITQGVKEIAKGNFSYRIHKKGQDEISSLIENINRMAEDLQESIENERKIEKQKNELVTNVSHDLRTPLTSIMGYLRLVRDEKYTNLDELRSYIRIAYSKSEQLKNLIEDLFEYTKLTNDTIALNVQRICMNELLDQLIEEIIPQAEEFELSIVREFSSERFYTNIDSEKMVRVFDNLLMNAMKYSKDAGEISVSLQKQQHYLKVSIANYSEEFTEDELENLFERFYKKDKSRYRVEEGSGLGLAIAESIVKLHGGQIWAEFADGVIHFHIMLPIHSLHE